MSIKDYPESTIREKILVKLEPRLQKGRKHDKAYIYLDDVLVTKVKLPNAHNRIMKENKSRYICSVLRLKPQDFNRLIDCPLRGPEYYALLRNRAI